MYDFGNLIRAARGSPRKNAQQRRARIQILSQQGEEVWLVFIFRPGPDRLSYNLCSHLKETLASRRPRGSLERADEFESAELPERVWSRGTPANMHLYMRLYKYYILWRSFSVVLWRDPGRMLFDRISNRLLPIRLVPVAHASGSHRSRDLT